MQGAQVKEYLDRKRIPCRLVRHEAVFKCADSARVRKLELKQIAKALLYLADEKQVLVILPGNREVEDAKLLRVLKAKKARLASKQEVKRLINCDIGVVPPTVEGVKKIIDTHLLENELVSFNAGIPTAGIIIKPKDLLKALDNYCEADVALGKTIIGLEVHVQLHTASKLFCSCPTAAVQPNSAVCEICLGHPGSKPSLNRKAVDYALSLALGLNCKINKEFSFSRKTYFYPDMAKNFQITQYETPIGENGFVVLGSGRKVGISRIHLEEDPAALVHEGTPHKSGICMIDYNRSGIPLVEIVTAPEIDSPNEAREFLDKLLSLLNYTGAFIQGEDVIKADANISIEGSERVEIKNITGFRNVEKALFYEEKRQRSLIERGAKVVRETRGFDETTCATRTLRRKETEEDYGYITETDLVVVVVDDNWLKKAREMLPELPDEKKKRFMEQYGLNDYDAAVLCSDLELAKLFEAAAKKVDAKLTARFLTRELLAVLNYNNLNLRELNLEAAQIVSLLGLLQSGKVTEKNAKEAIIKYVNEKTSPVEFLEKNDMLKDADEGTVDDSVEKILEQNKKAVEDYRKGEEKAMNFLVGLVMRETKGKAEPRLVQKKIEEILG